MNNTGKPDAGNLPVRFEEGDQGTPGPYSTASVVKSIALSRVNGTTLVSRCLPTSNVERRTRFLESNANFRQNLFLNDQWRGGYAHQQSDCI